MAIPTVSDVRTYLGAGVTASDAQVQGALDAEAAAQAATVRVGDYGNAAIREALLRRVKRNLAMRAVPLGVQVSVDGVGTYISATDPEIRRLEAPFRRLVFG